MLQIMPQFLSQFTPDTMSFVIAKDGRCKTFDADADGFGRAEGCAVSCNISLIIDLKNYAATN